MTTVDKILYFFAGLVLSATVLITVFNAEFVKYRSVKNEFKNGVKFGVMALQEVYEPGKYIKMKEIYKIAITKRLNAEDARTFFMMDKVSKGLVVDVNSAWSGNADKE